MNVEPWLGWWRSWRALLWTGLTLVLAGASSHFSSIGQCEYVSIGGELSLPLGYPLHPTTPEGRVAVARLISVMNVVSPLSAGMALVLLAGILWSRALRSARLVLALLLVPGMAAVLELTRQGLYLTWASLAPEDSTWFGAATYWLEEGLEPVRTASLWLIALGLAALVVRKARALKPAP